MNKPFLLLLVSFFICFSASAQFWKKAPKPVRLPVLQQSPTNIINFEALNKVTLTQLSANVDFPRTSYSDDLQEAAIMKELYHTLRFRMYPEAIDGFKRLIALYISENRYSEAKWYLLQCNYFGHKSNNTTEVVTSLVSLGMLKADIGEYDQAKEDLLQAQDICKTQGMAIQATEIDKKLKIVEVKRFANVKNEVRYAEIAENKKG